MSDYKVEFPSYESAIPPVFLSWPWQDRSWHNDSCPSFSRPFDDGREVHVFVDEADPAKRCKAEDYPRFLVQTTDRNGVFDADDSFFESDSLEAVLDHVGFLVGEVSR